MATKPKPATAKQVELNRWCIEMAMRWPLVRLEPRYGNGLGAQGPFYGPNSPGGDVDADVIARANKIRTWVLAA